MSTVRRGPARVPEVGSSPAGAVTARTPPPFSSGTIATGPDPLTVRLTAHVDTPLDTPRRRAPTESTGGGATDLSALGRGTVGSGLRRSLRSAGDLHGVCGLIAAERAGEVVLDLLLSIAAVLIAELHADPRGALALSAFGRHPDDPPRHRQLLLLAHEVQKHEDLVSQAIVAVGGNEQTAILHERHVREIERAFILDREGEKTRLVTGTTQCRGFRHFNAPMPLDLRVAAPRAQAADSARSRQDAATPGPHRAARTGALSWA